MEGRGYVCVPILQMRNVTCHLGNAAGDMSTLEQASTRIITLRPTRRTAMLSASF